MTVEADPVPAGRMRADPLPIGWDATGVVLAGGRSSRFGSDKLAAELDGVPLLHHAVTRVAEVTGDVVVVLASDAEEPSMPRGPSVTFARDAVADEGPLAGTLAGIALVTTRLALVVGGDMPDLSTAVLREMLSVARRTDAGAVALQDGDRFRPLPAVLRVESARTAAPPLLADGERRLRALVRALDPTVIDEASWLTLDPERRTLLDVDQPDDLVRAEASAS
jgi:molybdopterin-guanine dinucleotide biosynthesis protein A